MKCCIVYFCRQKLYKLDITSSNTPDSTSLYSWYKAEGLSYAGMEDDTLCEVTAGVKQVGIVKRQGIVYAFAAKCPHAGIPLCEGWMDAQGRIVCPKHKYRFDPVNGRNTSGEGYKLFTYKVQIRDDEVWVGYIG